jgi:hypothetical protein
MRYLRNAALANRPLSDRKVIEPGFKEFGMPITILDADGNINSQ